MESEEIKGQTVETTLSRDLTFTGALAIGVGTMIAAGIFTLSGLAIRNVGSAAIVAFGAAAVVSLFTALTYCEFVSIYPRSGEGYLYARKTFIPPVAYLVGWALFLGYTSSCAFYIASFSSYFVEFIVETPFHGLSGIIALIALMFLNIKGTKESGGFQVVITFVKVLLLVWFIFGGMSHVDPQEMIDKFESDFVKIASTSALVFITFFGFSAIAASAGEVKNPIKNIPKAIFWSVGIVTILYVGVVLVTIAANLNEYTEASMGAAAKIFLGGVGGMVIVGGALFSMLSASNASIMAGSRVALAMSQLGHLPKEIGIVNSRTRTPIIAVFLVCGVIAIFAVVLPLEGLAHYANTVLLLALILVNIALIVHRRKFPDIERPFRVPLVPLVPILGIVANLYLLIQIFQHPIPVALALASLLLGIIGFFTWKGSQPAEEWIPGGRSQLAMGVFSDSPDDKRFKILVPVANPATAGSLIKLAAAVAKERDGVIILLKVATIAKQVPLSKDSVDIEKQKEILDFGAAEANKYGVPVTTLLKIGYNTARAILETASERKCGLILLGWKGFSNNRDKILGQVTDAVVANAKCDIMLVKFAAERKMKKIMIPTAGGVNARSAEMYAANFAKTFGASLTLFRVGKPKEAQEQKQNYEKNLQEIKARIENLSGVKADDLVVYNNSIPRAIIHAENDFDTIILGATRDRIFKQIMFGSIPEMIARYTKKNVIVVKHYRPVADLIGRAMAD